MNTLRRITRRATKVAAAGAVLVAVALPAVAMTAPASAATAAPTLTCTVAPSGVCGAGSYAIIGQGYTGTFAAVGTGFAANQALGGQVTLTTNAPGVTFTNVQETSTSTLTAAIASSSATTTPGFYSVTLTDSNGTVTLPLGLGVDVGPQIASVTGTAGVSGGAASTVTITGTNLRNATASFVTPASGTAPTVGANSTASSDTTATFTVTNTAATAGTFDLVITSPYPFTGARGATSTTYTVTGAAVTGPQITAVTPSELPIGSLTGNQTSTTAITVTGTGFQVGAKATIAPILALNDPYVVGTLAYASPTTLTGSVTLKAGVQVDQATITVTNPDLSTTTAVGALGLGEPGGTITSPTLPVAPAFAVTLGNPIEAGVSTIVGLQGTANFPLSTSSTVTFSNAAGASFTGTVKSVDATNTATVNANVPRYLSSTLAATTAAGATSLTLASVAGLPATGHVTIVDGTNTETVAYTAITGNTLTVAATANAHAAGVVVQWPLVAGVYTVTVNNGANTATNTISVNAALAATYNGQASVTLNPGTYQIAASVPGFNFVSGATIVFPGTSGTTGTVSVINAGQATLNVTIPATIAAPATLTSGGTAGNDNATITSANAAVKIGQSLTVGPNPTDANKVTQTLTVATVAGSNPYTVTFTTNFSQNFVAGVPVTGLTQPQPVGNINAVLTNGSGQAEVITPLIGTAAVGTATAVPATLGAGASSFPIAFTLSSSPFDQTAANWTITSTTPGVSFSTTSISGTALGATFSVATGTPATASVPVVITDGSTSYTATLATTATVPTVTGVTGVATITPGSFLAPGVTIGVYGTNFNAATDECSTSDPNVLCTVTPSPTNSATVLTVTLTPTESPNAAGLWMTPLNGSDTVSITDPSTGGTGTFGPAVSVSGFPVATAVSPTTVNAGATSLTTTVTGTGFTNNITECESYFEPTGGTSYSYWQPCTATYVSATSVTVTDGGGYFPGNVVYLIISDTGTDYWLANTPPISVIPAPVASFFSTGGTVAEGSTSAPFKLVGSGFLPGTTASIPAADGSVTVSLVTPNAIFGTVTINQTGVTLPVTLTVKNTNGTTSTVNFNVTPAPVVTSPTSVAPQSVVNGATTTIKIKGSGFVSGATVTAVGTAGLVTFGTAVVSSTTVPTDTCLVAQDANCNLITVAVSPVGFSGSTPIAQGFTVTNPVGDGAITVANGLLITPSPAVTGTYYVPTFTTNAEVTITGSGFQAGITAASSNPDYSVLLVASTSTTVTLLVTTTSNATSGTSSTITLTNPDGGSTTFPLNGGPNPNTVTPAPKAVRVAGEAVRGKNVPLIVVGTHFYGQPRITSNAKGTRVTVSGNNGTRMTIHVTSPKNLPSKTYTLTIVFANGEQTSVKYILR